MRESIWGISESCAYHLSYSGEIRNCFGTWHWHRRIDTFDVSKYRMILNRRLRVEKPNIVELHQDHIYWLLKVGILKPSRAWLNPQLWLQYWKHFGRRGVPEFVQFGHLWPIFWGIVTVAMPGSRTTLQSSGIAEIWGIRWSCTVTPVKMDRTVFSHPDISMCFDWIWTRNNIQSL